MTGIQRQDDHWLVKCCAYFLLGLGWLSLLGGCWHGLSSGEGRRVQGQVVDPAGLGLAGLEVQVEAPRLGLKHVVSTDPNGRFELTYLLDAQQQRQPLTPRLSLRLSAWKSGFEPRELVVSYPGGQLVLEPIRLEPEAEELFTQPDLEPDTSVSPELPPAGRTGRGE